MGEGLLGDKTPQSLLDTMVFYNRLFFPLRSGQEHRQLRSEPCQISVVEPSDGRAYLKYVEDISKNRPGGIKGKWVKPKIVHHENPTNSEPCIVRVFKQYPATGLLMLSTSNLCVTLLKHIGFQRSH